MITLNDYQARAHETAQYPPGIALEYTTLGLVGESGEIANKVKKTLRGDYSQDDIREDLIDELGDVLWYLAEAATVLNTTLEEVAQRNLDKLASRADRGVIKGAGDGR